MNIAALRPYINHMHGRADLIDREPIRNWSFLWFTGHRIRVLIYIIFSIVSLSNSD